jgi:hypothetical protein
MRDRERFLATARYQPVDRTYLLAPWTWESTLLRWQHEGLPANASLPAYFMTDDEYGVPLVMQGPYGPHLHPPLERTILEETPDYSVVRDAEGNVVKIFKDDPLCSPATYRTFMLPPLKRVTEVLHRYGVDIIIVDSDGNNDVLVPLWLEAGITGLRPFEIAAGCDPVAMRKRYGHNLIIQGGVDKRALALSREAIDREVLSKVPWLCLQGGYFPQVDHLVPPDVPLENYVYYSQLMRHVVEEPERYLHEARRRGYWDN